MKSFAPIVAFAGLLCCLFSCDTGKSGPFTFTNTTGTAVAVLIDQDGILEKEFVEGEKYTGKDYFTPQITFVKGFSSAEDKSIIDNKFTATTSNGFDYSFVKAPYTTINIIVILEEELTDELTGCYLVEAQGKLGEYSNTTITLERGELNLPDSEKKLYTNTPHFRIYNQEEKDVTDLFIIALEKSEIPPESNTGTATVQWNLEITYPKVEVVQE